jgi:hypothetical protein
MLVTLGPQHDQGTTVPTWRGSFALLCLLGSASSALAQGPDDFLRTFGTIKQPATVQATQAAWAELPSEQAGCINDALYQQGGSVEALIQRGVLPSDSRLANARSNCQNQFERQDPQPTGGQSSAYAVSDVALGATVKFGSSAYKEYRCAPSDQFDGFTWCQKTRKGKERRGKFNATYSILHSRDGVAVYLNRYQEPAFFGASEADDDIQRYSRKIGESPRITRMPHRGGYPNGILASWGKVELEPLDKDSIKALAEGRRPITKGYFIDFIGNFARSGKEGLPVYRLSGGAGFVWVASYGRKGHGTLRLVAVDASAISPRLVATPASANPTNQRPQGALSIAPLPPITADRAEQRKIAEAKASHNLANAPVDLQFLMRGLRIADDFIKLAEETFLATFNDVEADEFTTDISTDVRRKSPKGAREIYQQIAFQNFRQCFFLSDSGCNRTYGILSGVMPTLNPALGEVIAQPDPIREFKYEGQCFFSVALDVKKSLLQKNPDGSYQKDQTGHVAYFLNFNGLDPNSVKIIDAPEFIKIGFEPPRRRLVPDFPAYFPGLTNGSPRSPNWQARYDRFVSSMMERTSVKKFVIIEKRTVHKFPSAPVSVLLADVDELTGEEHDWNPLNYDEEVQPFAIQRSSLKRFPVLAFESSDADFIAENLNSVIQNCQNDRY